MSKRTTTTSAHSPESGERWKPRKYMKVAVLWLVKRPEAILLLDPGLGKTSIMLAAFKALRKARGVKKALVLAPKRACEAVWTHDVEGELSKWIDFQDLRDVFLHGPQKDRLLEADADLYVVNFEGLQWLCGCRACDHTSHDKRCNEVVGEKVVNGKKRKVACGCDERDDSPIDDLLRKGVDTLIVDELSKFKHTNTKRFKAIKHKLKRFRRRWGGTGDPVANNMEDLFGETYTIDLGRCLGDRITHFRFNYFTPTGFGGYQWRIKSEAAEKAIFKKLKPVALAMKAEDHLDMPELVRDNIWVELPDEARRIYDEMEEELYTLIEDEEVTAANAAVASGKCRQVASGGLYLDPRASTNDRSKKNQARANAKRRVAVIHNAKTEALRDLYEELQGSPLLVVYEFHHDLERIREEFGDVPAINGSTKDADFRKIVVDWNDGKIPMLCGQPQSMGHALNLQRSGNHVAFYTSPWDGELDNQVMRRVYRQGQKHKTVVVHRLLARKTVDEDVLASLARKRRGQQSLFDSLKRGVLERRKK